MKRHHTCRTCAHFRPGAPSNMSEPAPIESDAPFGVCEANMPDTARQLGSPAAVGLQPIVHASRSCAEYLPHGEYDGDDGDGEPVPLPSPKPILQSVPKVAA